MKKLVSFLLSAAAIAAFAGLSCSGGFSSVKNATSDSLAMKFAQVRFSDPLADASSFKITNINENMNANIITMGSEIAINGYVDLDNVSGYDHVSVTINLGIFDKNDPNAVAVYDFSSVTNQSSEQTDAPYITVDLNNGKKIYTSKASESDGELEIKEFTLGPDLYIYGTFKGTLGAEAGQSTKDDIAKVEGAFTFTSNVAPVASFTMSPPIPTILTTVLLDASGSYDLEDGTSGLSYRWDYDSDGNWDTAWLASATSSTIYGGAQYHREGLGLHRITLSVKDSDSTENTQYQDIEVANTSPGAAFTFTNAGGNTRNIDNPFNLDATSCTDVEDDISSLQVRWDFDSDGTWETSWSTDKTSSTSWHETGSYLITMEVMDSDGLKAGMSATAYVVVP